MNHYLKSISIPLIYIANNLFILVPAIFFFVIFFSISYMYSIQFGATNVSKIFDYKQIMTCHNIYLFKYEGWDKYC